MRYVFDDCVLDAQRHELRRAGVPVPLERKVYQVLLYLVRHANRLVPKDELLEQVWPNVYVTDKVVARCIAAIRRAVGDSAAAQRMIQTVHGEGYRWVAAVVIEDAHAPAMAAAVAPAGEAPARVPPSTVPQPVSGLTTSLPLSDAPLSAPGGERKLVTVLCCHLAHTAAMVEGMDVEEQHHLLQAFFAQTATEVRHYGGTIVHLLDESVVAVFGAPMAYEDHAQRAVLAALGLRERVRPAPAGAGEALTVCIGLHTGPVVVGQVAVDMPMAYTSGDTLALARQLARHAAPGTIMLSETTARLVAHTVRLEALPLTPGQGLTVPLAGYQVLGRLPQRVPMGRLGERTLTPFVGRQDELKMLQALLAQVARGRGQIVGLVGEPGMGKSRLLYEFRRSLQEHQVTYLAGGCVSYGSTTPYLPILDLLRQCCGCVDTDPPDVIRARLRQCLANVPMASTDWLPCLFQLLGVQDDPSAWEALEPRMRKQHTFAALHELSRQRSRQRPLILEVENLHWIDPSSEEYLVALAERLPGMAVLLLTTYRPGYRPRWMDKSYATQIVLPPLTQQESEQVVHARLQAMPEASHLVPAILAKAHGNPLFLEELARGAVAQAPGQTRWTVPDTIQAVLAARIDRLPPAAKRVLHMAAVVGAEVPVAMLQALTNLPGEALGALLDHLRTAELLYETRLVPGQTYTFAHVLIQEVAYQALLRRTRQQLHAQIAQVLTAQFPTLVATQPDLLAHHYTGAGLAEPAIAAWRQAGQQALERAAYGEAMACFEQALEALQRLPGGQRPSALAIDLRFDLCQALRPLVALDRAIDTMLEAERLATALGDRHRLGRVFLELSGKYRNMGDQEQAIAYSQRALTLAATLDDRTLQIHASYNLGIARHARGDYALAAALHRDALVALQTERHSERLPGFPLVYYRTWLLLSLAMLGEFTEGSALAEDLLRLAVSHPRARIAADAGIGTLYLFQGEMEHAIAILEHGLELSRRWNLQDWYPPVASALGYIYALRGQVTAALPLLEHVVEHNRSTKSLCNQALRVAWLSEAYLCAGRTDDARHRAQQALQLAQTHQEQGNQAYALRLLGEIYARSESRTLAPAVTYYQQARALAAALGMRPLLAHCHLGLGRLYRQHGQNGQAQTEITTAMALYQAMHMPFWWRQAAAV